MNYHVHEATGCPMEVVLCYPNRITGAVASDFSDAETLRNLNHTLPTYLGLTPAGGKFRMTFPDGESHEFGSTLTARAIATL